MMREQGRPAQYIETLGMFAPVGLRESDGTPKPALAVWDAYRADRWERDLTGYEPIALDSRPGAQSEDPLARSRASAALSSVRDSPVNRTRGGESSFLAQRAIEARSREGQVQVVLTRVDCGRRHRQGQYW